MSIVDWQPIETAPRGIDVLLYTDRIDLVWIGHRFPDDADWYPQEDSTFQGAPTDVPPSHWATIPHPPRVA